MRNIEFVPKAFEEYQNWIETDRKTALRIGDLIRDIYGLLFQDWENRNH
jgi:toxin YoeB